MTGSARPHFSNRAGKTLGLLGAVCLVLILTECTVCEGKLMLLHVFVSTDVEQATPAPRGGDVEGRLPLLGWGSAGVAVRGCLETRNNLLLTQR